MKKVLVLCTGNSCRSQIAEAYLRLFAAGRAEIFSAGVETHGLNPLAVATMREDGIDISGQTSNHVDEYRQIPFDFVITVCDNAKESCPIFLSAAKTFHYDFQDPAKASGTDEDIQKFFSSVRNEIREYCHNWINENL